MDRDARITAIRWFGPFYLEGKPGDPADIRLAQFNKAPALDSGLYIFAGRKKKWGVGTLFEKTKPLYIGMVNDTKAERRTFSKRFVEHLGVSTSDPTKDNKLWYIEQIGVVESIWLGIRETSSNLKSIWAGEKNDIEAMENLLIHMIRPELCSKDLNAPSDRRILVNHFDTTLWHKRALKKWLPNCLPDVLDFDSVTGHAVGTWTGRRGKIVSQRVTENIESGELC